MLMWLLFIKCFSYTHLSRRQPNSCSYFPPVLTVLPYTVTSSLYSKKHEFTTIHSKLIIWMHEWGCTVLFFKIRSPVWAKLSITETLGENCYSISKVESVYKLLVKGRFYERRIHRHGNHSMFSDTQESMVSGWVEKSGSDHTAT